MLLQEIFSNEQSFRSEEDDESTLKVTDTRKTKLTLKHISMLRLMNDQKTVEFFNKTEKIKRQYGKPPSNNDGF